MPSRHATRMQDAARPLIWRTHAERVVISEGGSTRDVDGVWKRIVAEGGGVSDGRGAQEYEGSAVVTVKRDDFETLPGPTALVVRNGESWVIHHIEPQDDWTYVFHLSRPDADVHVPTRLRK